MNPCKTYTGAGARDTIETPRAGKDHIKIKQLSFTPPPYTGAGAHNTIVTSRAGKDLVSCLVSGLLTIGPRFGGAIDDAARNFKAACDQACDSCLLLTT